MLDTGDQNTGYTKSHLSEIKVSFLRPTRLWGTGGNLMGPWGTAGDRGGPWGTAGDRVGPWGTGDRGSVIFFKTVSD